jgi:hypothetical protein
MSETSERIQKTRWTKQYRSPWIAFYTSILLVLIYVAMSFFVTRGETIVEKSNELFVTFCSESDTRGIPANLIAEDGCPNAVTAFIAFEGIDITKRTVRLWLRLYPQGEQGIALFNGGYFNKTLDVGFSAIGEGNWDVPSKEWVGGKSIELPLESRVSEAGYPFDTYSGRFNILINEAVSGSYIPISMAFSQKQVSGFNITPQILAPEMTVGNKNIRVYESGVGGFEFEVHRSSSQQMHFGILVAIITIGAISSIVTTLAVARRKRPPSLAILAWLATYLFALIQVRGEFPGSPALGVSVDRYLTFPAIAVIMVLIVANVVSWLHRKDWDAENQEIV